MTSPSRVFRPGKPSSLLVDGPRRGLVGGIALAVLLLLAEPGAAAATKPSTANPDAALRYFEAHDQARLVPMLLEVLRFPTFAGNDKAHAEQNEWLRRTAQALGFIVREAGPVTEIEMPGPAGAPVLGLVVHGDVVPVEEAAWKTPPFAPEVREGAVWGRGAADDKGPLVQALLAMHALCETRLHLTHTIRLLVGSDEESGAKDMGLYLVDHRPPDYSLVLDAVFPVVVGEKSWNALRLTVDPADGGTAKSTERPWVVVDLDAGLATSIVPDRARLALHWRDGEPRWAELTERVRARPLPPGTRLDVSGSGADLVLTTSGHAAHAGMNIEGGRNALVALAVAAADELPAGDPGDLLRFALAAGGDVHGATLGLPAPDPRWHGYDVNVATLKTLEGRPTLTLNVRQPPPWKAEDLRTHLEQRVALFNREQGTRLRMDPTFYFDDETLAFDARSPLVVRLLDAYARASGEAAVAPAVVGGATYAKRIPRAIAFGMWFGDTTYPGHDVDERNAVKDLVRGTRILIAALAEIASGAPMDPERALRRLP